ncbi:hypothetical protein OS493_027807 [Desmophyllum pertusum]|uniref:Coiled-coil domain-containing protein 137 n=1 Tax=Desmophyllum pertusum TaxID=174260 RepID=A0A9W9YYK4_9CNID|nr:hypothetical protein OS493_027807 [Desmophyllum pertusum]
MPRAAKDLFRRQLAMKNKTTVKKTDRKKKKQGMTKFQRIPGESKKQYFDRIDREATVEVAETLKASRKMRDGRKKHLNERKQKIKEKKRSSEEHASFDSMKDSVRFGDVVMQPPSLTAKPRKASQKNKGSKTLLLHSLISQEQDTNIDTKAQIKTPANPGLPKTKKRKHMSALERDKADKERERAIMAYRQLRKQRLQEKNEAV